MNNIINQSIQNIQKSQNLVTKIENELKKGTKGNKGSKNNPVKIEFKPTIKIEIYGNSTSTKKALAKKKKAPVKKKASVKKKTPVKKKMPAKKKAVKTSKKTARNKLYNFFNPK
jgi:hypothetical protein